MTFNGKAWQHFFDEFALSNITWAAENIWLNESSVNYLEVMKSNQIYYFIITGNMLINLAISLMEQIRHWWL